MASTGLRDLPITNLEEENLDVTPYIESLAQFIMECDTPMTIAVQGDWGSGKTSMMNLVKASIEATYPGKMHPVWFNTWQYSQFNAHDQLGISLLSRFATEISVRSDMGERVKKMLGTVVKNLARNVAFVGTMAITGSAEGAKDAQQAVDGAFSKDFVQSLTELKDSIVKITMERLDQDKKDRIVVFIDDLDRLVPERAVELLEVFKLFLDVPGCVFVLACDYQVIAQGLKAKFNIGDGDLKGKSFFDKIIQLPFSMPVGQYDTRRYTSDLLTRIGITAAAEDLEKYRRLIAASVGLNPRSMKRLFNAFQLINLAATRKGVLKDTGTASYSERQRILLACLCLQTAYEPAYQYLVGLGQKLTEDTLRTLQGVDADDEEELGPLLAEIGGKKSAMALRLPAFIETFLDAIQLKSDGSEALNKSELDNLVDILSFSSITATTAPIQTQDGDERDSLTLKTFLQQLAMDFNDQLQEASSDLRDEFKLTKISRKGRSHGILSTPQGFLVERKRVMVSCEFCDRSAPSWGGVYLTTTKRQFEWLCSRADSLFGARRPYKESDYIDEHYGLYYVGYMEFNHDQPIEEKLQRFEEMVNKCFSLIVHEFNKLRNGD